MTAKRDIRQVLDDHLALRERGHDDVRDCAQLLHEDGLIRAQTIRYTVTFTDLSQARRVV